MKEMKMEKVCLVCGEKYIAQGHPGNVKRQKYCSKKCKRKNDNLKYYEKKVSVTLKKASTPQKITNIQKSKKGNLKQEIDSIHQPLYHVKKGFNLIKKLNKIHEDLVNYMNILKLDTYPEEIKNHCIYIMKESNRFLQNQLKLERDKGVIIVQKE